MTETPPETLTASICRIVGQEWCRVKHGYFSSNHPTRNLSDFVTLQVHDGLLVLCQIYQDVGNGEITIHPMRFEGLKQYPQP